MHLWPTKGVFVCKMFRTDCPSNEKLRALYCQAQPKPQLQLQVEGTELALFFFNPATHPPLGESLFFIGNQQNMVCNICRTSPVEPNTISNKLKT
jgi:hypothetical protein